MKGRSLLSVLFSFLILTSVFVPCTLTDEHVYLSDDEGDDTGEAIVAEDSTTETPIPETDEPEDSGRARISFMLAEPANLDSIQFSKPVKILVNLANEAKKKDYYFHHIAASFRYPADISYVLQNLTTMRYNAVVKPGTEATFQYGFILHDDYAARSVVLIVEALYADDQNQIFEETVVNHTTTILEADNGIDGELIFMYLLLIALAIVAMFAVYHFTMRKLRGSFAFASKGKASGSAGLSGSLVMKNDVDLEWIPKEILKQHTESRKQAYLRNRIQAEETAPKRSQRIDDHTDGTSDDDTVKHRSD